MRYKIISILAVIGIILFAAAFSIDWKTGKARVHQHLSWQKETTPNEITDDPKELATHLPIVEIQTNGQKIPGNWIRDENDIVIGEELSDTQEKTILASLKFIDNGTGENRPGDSAAAETLARFRIRGNSSRNFSKKSYALSFVTEDGKENPLSIMGMAEHDRWALYGPFLDKTLIRNYMWMNLSAELMGYAPNVRFCEVILDGEYQGLYVMMETIARGEGRVNLSAYEEGASYTDYIVRVDKSDQDKNLEVFSDYTLRLEGSSKLSVVYPGTAKLNEKIRDYIAKDFSKFEKALYSSDYQDPLKGYRRYIDVDSFVDYYILQEFLCNNDMCSRSTYLYKDRLGKLHMGPVWDYNNVLDNYFVETDSSEIKYADRLWYDRLLADPYFNQKVIQRYKLLRQTVLNEDYLIDYIDQTIDYLGTAVERNYLVWGYSFDASLLDPKERLAPEERNPSDYEEAVEDMKEFLRVRGRWLDNHIEALAQHCHESRAKVYDTK